MKRGRIHVTDHAILQYLQRIRGVDIEGLRRRLERMADRAADFPDTPELRINVQTSQLVVSDGKVVTVVPRGHRTSRGRQL